MDRSVARLDRLVTTLLDVSRLHREPLATEREDLDLSAVAREVVEAVREAHGGVVELDAPFPVRGRWDRSRIGQTLENLVTNAVKFGRGKPVHVQVEAAGTRARVTVRDQGIGIAAADQARIFERFSRAVSQRNYGGFGLGLWIAKRAVEAHGGSIAVESSRGEGATFRVLLPLSDGAARS